MLNPQRSLVQFRSIPTPGDRRLTTRFANDVTDCQLFFAFFQAKSENVKMKVYRVYRVYRALKPFASKRFLLNLLVHLVKNEGVPGVPGLLNFIGFIV
jgi:hypothetical protein